MPAPGFLEILQIQLRQPEYLHVLLNPVPIYGTAFGMLALVAAFILKSRAAQIVALLFLLVSGLSAWPVQVLGQRAEEGIESSSDRLGRDWLELHAHRAEKALPLFYTLAAASLLALLLPKILPKTAGILSLITLVLALMAMLAGAWIGSAGGKIRHNEFRYGPPLGKRAKSPGK